MFALCMVYYNGMLACNQFGLCSCKHRFYLSTDYDRSLFVHFSCDGNMFNN